MTKIKQIWYQSSLIKGRDSILSKERAKTFSKKDNHEAVKTMCVLENLHSRTTVPETPTFNVEV